MSFSLLDLFVSCVCVHVWACTDDCGPEEGARSLGARVAGVCQLGSRLWSSKSASSVVNCWPVSAPSIWPSAPRPLFDFILKRTLCRGAVRIAGWSWDRQYVKTEPFIYLLFEARSFVGLELTFQAGHQAPGIRSHPPVFVLPVCLHLVSAAVRRQRWRHCVGSGT